MINLILKADSRKVTGKKVKNLRKEGYIPAVLYGHNIKSRNLSVKLKIFEKIYQQAGESSLIDLIIDKEKPVKVIIQDIQEDPLTGRIFHIDFYQVKMTEKLHTRAELRFVGEALAVKELNGILVTNLKEVEIECLPQNLIHEIKVDLSSLKTFDNLIYVSDLEIPENIKILNASQDVVASVQPPRREEIEEVRKPEEIPVAEKEASEKEAVKERAEVSEKSRDKSKGRNN